MVITHDIQMQQVVVDGNPIQATFKGARLHWINPDSLFDVASYVGIEPDALHTLIVNAVNSQALVSLFADHGIKTRVFRGRLQAEDICTVQRNGRSVARRSWCTVQGWTRRQALTWIGY